MMMENKNLELIEGYVLETLTDHDLQLLNELRKENPTIEKQITFYVDLREGAVLFGDAQFKLELQEMERNWQLKQRATLQDVLKEKWRSLADKTEGLMNELSQFFTPIPNYEAVLLQATRSTFAGLITPPNGIDATESLPFSFAIPLNKTHQFVVENNRLEIVAEYILSKGTTRFTLEVTDYLPGRYYWKLMGDRKTTIGMFFVGRI